MAWPVVVPRLRVGACFRFEGGVTIVTSGDGRRKRVSGHDIARLAGVSQSTVSRVINDHPRIAPETRERVRKAMEELGYTPNAAARTLITGRSHLIGLVVSNISNPFYPPLVEAIVNAAEDAGFHVILGNAQEDATRQLEFLRLLAEHQVDGAILTSALGAIAPELSRFAETGPPLVLVNRVLPDARIDSVLIDNERGGYLATEHLIALGHTRIAYVGGNQDASTNHQRFAGFRQAMEDAGIPVPDDHVNHGDYTRLSGSIIAKRLLQLPEPPTALVCADDLIALGCMEGLHAAGLQVPDDVALVGFDDIPSASLHGIGLTTVRQPTVEMGERAVKLMLDRLEHQDRAPVVDMLPAELIIRTSCGTPRGASVRQRQRAKHSGAAAS